MNLHKSLTVAGKTYALVEHNSRLNLFTPGRAVFTVQATGPLTGIVIFSCGYDRAALSRWFIGYVDTSTTVDQKQQRLFCRELSAALFKRLPLVLRDVDIKKTLAAITANTALQFELPGKNKNYLTRKAAAFYNTGNGYHAMDSLAGVYGIDKLIWQQQISGKIFVGSWNDSPWSTKPITLSNTWETQVTAANGATLPAVPSLRPGVNYNHNIITEVEFSGSNMKLTWAANPWGQR